MLGLVVTQPDAMWCPLTKSYYLQIGPVVFLSTDWSVHWAGAFLIYNPFVSEIAIRIGFKGGPTEGCPSFLLYSTQLHRDDGWITH
jgi:hypothetical protein